MPSYLIECYVPRSRAADVQDTAKRIRAAAEQLSREGTQTRYVRTTFVPDDETCFHVFRAPSAEAAEEVARLAGLGGARVLAAVERRRGGRDGR